jgi:hypothetical protein
MSAVSGLGDRVTATEEDQALTENPLMLTAICMVFERYRSLPDDRGRLCDLLIDDLCRSRRSEDSERGWKLDEAGKKDLLQRIALAMQKEGAQSWPVGRAIDISTQLVPTTDQSMMARAKRYVDWAAEHTGILRFHEGKNGEEHIRFWHRIFREYLSAKQLAQEDSTAGEKITKLWLEKRLVEPFWEDVVRLLPRTLGTIEKAKSVRESLQQLAGENGKHRGRLLGLAAAGIIENRDLFPDVSFSGFAEQMSTIYGSEGLSWSHLDRILFLEGLGRLDPSGGDPRFREEKWVAVPGLPKNVRFAWAPVSVHEFQKFVENSEFKDLRIWRGFPAVINSFRDQLPNRLRRQYRHPNWPVVDVSLFEALAYCRWLTQQRRDGKIVRLPRKVECQALAKPLVRSLKSVDISEERQSTLRRCPIGSYVPFLGLADSIGHLWQWAMRPEGEEENGRQVSVVFGGRFPQNEEDFLTLQPDDLEFLGFHAIGIRCLLAEDEVDVPQHYFNSARTQARLLNFQRFRDRAS